MNNTFDLFHPVLAINIMAGSLGGLVPAVKIAGLSVLSIVINSLCNLRCAHCYLQPKETLSRLRSADWLRFLRSVYKDLRPDAVCVSGKEVFASDESVSLFCEAIHLRNSVQADASAKTRLGVITNGTLLHNYRENLTSIQPDWLDVSIDGLEATHDSIRGKGAFAAMAANIPWVLETMGDRVWVSLTVMESNLDAIPEIVSGLNAGLGLRNFSIGVYKPQTYTSAALRVEDSNYAKRLVRALRRLAQIEIKNAVEVKLELESSCWNLQRHLEQEGFITSGGILRVTRRELSNGITLRVQATTVPVGLWRAARVTHQGQWLAAEDLVNAKLYDERAVGKIADFDFDALALYRAGLAHPRFRELFGTDAEQFLGTLIKAA
ncbi:MAG: radical SAM protein [Verrucomicrobia bacterium]|nr:radical SAM protein [Verrucomicrobiota bacterium]